MGATRVSLADVRQCVLVQVVESRYPCWCRVPVHTREINLLWAQSRGNVASRVSGAIYFAWLGATDGEIPRRNR